MDNLSRGEQPNVRTVASDAELQALFDLFSSGGTSLDRPTYDGVWVRLDDGCEIGIRNYSDSGGRTIDVKVPGLIETDKGPYRMTTMDEPTLIEDLLSSGVLDWVSVAEVDGIAARSELPDPNQRRHLAIGLVAEVLLKGLMVAGSTPPGGFVPWDITPAEQLERIACEWLAKADTDLWIGEICWLRNTELGNAIGRRVLDRNAGT